MLRYLGLVWNSSDPVQARAAKTLITAARSDPQAWSSLLLIDGLAIFCPQGAISSKDVRVLPNGGGAILGALFHRSAEFDGRSPDAVLSPSDADAILATRGRKLIESYWGNYVAFLVDARSHTQWILSAPSQSQEAFTTCFRGVHLCFSSLHGCPALDLLSFTLNWRYVELNLVCRLPENRATGLNEVTRLVGGECFEIRRDTSSIVCYWHPSHIASSPTIDDPLAVTQAMRRTTQYCIDAWASRHNEILHTLSGGLDSSVVLACLRAAPNRPRVTCLNFVVTDDPRSDEREYARLASRHTAVTLMEREVNPRRALVPALLFTKHPCPQPFTVEMLFASPVQEAAQDCGATGVFDGNGGDEMLGDCPPALALADYSHRHGLTPALLLYARRNARAWGMSTWHLLRQEFHARREHTTPGLFDVAPPVMTGLMREFSFSEADLMAFQHPWLNHPIALPPGRLAQVHSLIRAHSAPSTLVATSAQRVHPLASQPLTELSLRIPSYLHTCDGWSRAVARRAFDHALPREVIWRRGKGAIGHAIVSLVEHNLDLIRSMLIEGALVAAGVLEKAALERACSQPVSGMLGIHLMHILAVEAWARESDSSAVRDRPGSRLFPGCSS